MNAASLPHAKLMQAIEAIGTRVAPALRELSEQKGLTDPTLGERFTLSPTENWRSAL
jgi:hypothetical protein